MYISICVLQTQKGVILSFLKARSASSLFIRAHVRYICIQYHEGDDVHAFRSAAVFHRIPQLRLFLVILIPAIEYKYRRKKKCFSIKPIYRNIFFPPATRSYLFYRIQN